MMDQEKPEDLTIIKSNLLYLNSFDEQYEYLQNQYEEGNISQNTFLKLLADISND